MKRRQPSLERRHDNTCLTDCVARYFKLNPKRVPFFIAYPDWQNRLKSFYRRRRLRLFPAPYKRSLLSNPRRLYLVQGLSPRSKADPQKPPRPNQIHHAVLYRGKKPYYDPNSGGKFIKGRPQWIWLAMPIKPHRKHG